jgi:hypothetical protein
MNILILVVLMCAMIVLFAVAADRSARANRRWRAGLLNLCGLLLLVLGAFALFAWSHHGHSVSMHFGRPAYAGQVGGAPSVTDHPFSIDQSVRSLRDEEHPAENPEAKPAETPAEQPAAEAEPAETPAEQPAAEAEPAADVTGEVAESKGDGGAVDRSESDGAGQLSASPHGQVEIDYAARPEWVDRPEREEGPVHQIAVCSGPYLRSHEAHKELQRQLKRVTDEYINEYLGQQSASRWVFWDAARIGRELVSARNHFEEKVISPSFGVMYQSHALLEFGPDFHGQVEESWRQIQVRAQLVKVALGAAAVLGTLMLLFGFFQADTATRGFYSGRLKFATVVAILGLIACGVYLTRSIPWLWP